MSKKQIYYKSTKKRSYKRKKFQRILPYLVTIITSFFFFLFFFQDFKISKNILSFLDISNININGHYVESFTIFFQDIVRGGAIFFKSLIYITIGIILFVIMFSFLPFSVQEQKQFYIEKKVLIPYFRIVKLISIHRNPSSASYSPLFSDKINQRFVDDIFSTFNKTSILMLKDIDNVLFSFVFAEKGFFVKRLKKKIQKKSSYLENSLALHYKIETRTLSSKQVKHLRFLIKQQKKKYKIRTKDLIQTEKSDFIDKLYLALTNPTIESASIFITAQKGKKSSKAVLGVYIFTLTELEKTIIEDSLCFKLKKKYAFFSPWNLFFSIRRRNKRATVNASKIHSFFHIPSGIASASMSLLRERKSTFRGDKRKESMIEIGSIIENGEQLEPLKINTEDILYNVEIYGMIGQGKTSLVRNMINQLLEQNISCLVFDIKGEYASSFISNDKVEIYTIGKPNPLCINLFKNTDEEDLKTTILLIEEMMETAKQEFSPAMKNLFENTLFLTHKSKNPNLSVFVENLFNLASRIKEKINVAYIQQTLDAVLNRLNYIFNPTNFEILGVSKTTIDFSIFKRGKSIILDLSEFQKRAARPSDIFLITNLILKMFYKYASAEGTQDSLRYVVVLEEAVNIIPKVYNSDSSASLITAENNFLLGRNLGIGHITISQLWESVSNIVHGNSTTKIIFRTSEKSEYIASTLNLPENAVNKIHSLPRRCCLVLSKELAEAKEVRTSDCELKPLPRTKYRSLLNQRYQEVKYPLLYQNFIEMRNVINKELYLLDNNKEKTSSTKENSQKSLENILSQEIIFEEEKEYKEEYKKKKNTDNRDIEIVGTLLEKENFYSCSNCELESNSVECNVNRYTARIIAEIVLSHTEASLIKKEDRNQLNKLIHAALKSKKIALTKDLEICIKRQLYQKTVQESGNTYII